MIDFKDIQKRQWMLALGIGGALMSAGIGYVLFSSKGQASPSSSPEMQSSMITGTSRINPQEAWVYQFKEEADLNRKRMDELEDLMKKMMVLSEKKAERAPEKPKEEPIPQTIGDIRQELKAEVEKPMSIHELPPPPGSLAAGTVGLSPNNPPNLSAHQPPLAAPFRSKSVRKISLSLRNSRVNNPLKTADNTIPAGAFANAVLLGGVDASASIQASGDPRPALLRLTDDGTLPRKFRSDLKGCHVLAACYGDISSERVMMRLEKLTCTERKTGEIIEVKVQGYVAGEDGRTGVRGTVVDRAGDSMRNAMIGGFVSGMGEFLSQARNPIAFAPASGLAQVTPFGMGDALKHGAGKGANQALDKYADFYIKRAEQVQPVIQVAAGRLVNVVFTEGVSIGDSQYRQSISRTNDQGRYQQIAEGESK